MSMRSDRARRRAARRRNQRIVLILIGLVILGLLGFIAFSLLNDGNGDETPPVNTAQATTSSSGLQIQILEPGTGETARVGDTVTVHYIGTLENGTQFDSSYTSGQPASFALVSGGLIQGWVEGVDGMQVGEKRRLVIPPHLGYGAGGYPPVIPPNATLIFEIELLGVNR
jgi:FKBP-type peptidyl-prolyl cis-trans isomerase